jgi:tetratricopeptide (TPR) repeat protein
MGEPKAKVDFFISYTGADRAWAEWIAWRLEDALYTTVLQAWDFRPGDNFVVRMRDAMETAERTLAVISGAYLASPYCTDEWTGAFLHDPDGLERLLLVRVEDCQLPRLLATSVYLDLAEASPREATVRLLEGIRRGRAKPERAPPFPRSAARPTKRGEPRFPGAGPEVTNLPRRTPNFTGRRELLETLRANLRAGARGAVVQIEAIHGLGGVGKTELALEYAHRYASDYDLVWWVAAEQPAAVATDLVGLAGRLGIREAPQLAETIGELFDGLRGRDRWLLVFDNAEDPQSLIDYLPPGGSGHVLVTSRYAAWGQLAAPLRLDVLPQEEAVAFVRKRSGAIDESAAAALVDTLGGLPLALEEAAAYIEATGIGLDDYLGLLRERMIELFGLDAPTDTVLADERRVATIWSVSLERVRAEAPQAEALLELCAFLAPDGTPRALPAEHAELLPEDLARTVRDPLRYNEAVRVLSRYSLVTVMPDALGLHRLVQAVIRAPLDDSAKRRWAEVSVGLLRDSFPANCWELETWPACQQLLLHVLAAVEHAGRLEVAGEQAGWLLSRASAYLRGRGQYHEARPLAERAVTVTTKALGPDHPDVGDQHDELGRVLQDLGDYHSARQEYEEALRIAQANQEQQAYEIGSRHSHLGTILRALGDLTGAKVEHERALELGEATIGPDDPDMAARHSNFGNALATLGDLDGARTQYERALQIGQATDGPNHPEMAIPHNNLGVVLRDLGDLDGAHTQSKRA